MQKHRDPYATCMMLLQQLSLLWLQQLRVALQCTSMPMRAGCLLGHPHDQHL
jgi:hypothetical protein